MPAPMSNEKKVGFVLDPIAGLNTKKDTSLALVEAFQIQGWQPFYLEQSEMFLAEGKPMARMRTLNIELGADPWYQLGDARLAPLAELDALLMRKDPPFDMNYIYSTYILERAEAEGVLVVNRPNALRDCNEKLFATEFPQCCPELVVSSDASVLKGFHRQHGDVIYKPLDGMGGSSIFRAVPGEANLSVIIETLTQLGNVPIMAQKYLPEIVDGDKRILVVDGEPVSHCLARIPSKGETRGNLAAGGRGEVRPLTDRDRWIVSQVAPELKRRGLTFVGLDVIGSYLTEINVTSPTCVREIDAGAGVDIGTMLVNAVSKALSN